MCLSIACLSITYCRLRIVDYVFVDYVFVDCVFYFVFVRVAHMLWQVLDSLPAAYGLSRKQVQR